MWRGIFLVILIFFPLSNSFVQAQDAPILEPNPAFEAGLPPDTYARAQVLEVLEEGEQDLGDFSQLFQRLQVRILSGEEQGKEVEVDHGGQYTIQPAQMVEANDSIILAKSTKIDGSTYYYIADRLRLGSLFWLAAMFLGLVLLVSGWRGGTALIGLLVSILILIFGILPAIIRGYNPLLVSLIGSILIALLTLYLAHGFRLQTTVSVVGTILTLGVATSLAMLFAALAHLTGMGSEESFYLQIGAFADLNFRGLLLGGILIGTLGVLDDVATAQAALVFELKNANTNLSPQELYRRGLRVGREHVASLVNTLALAYVGASFPMFLMAIVQRPLPLWVAINSEFLFEEILRTLIGSSALILAVPITTALAAIAISRK
ncbi:YibE/F family protein [Candidatus Berkelbacteria bacterium]|nr:YibE/F family protein [Candidatus Berkelbacteria bacterium]